MRRFYTDVPGHHETMEVGRLDEPGVYVQIGLGEEILDAETFGPNHVTDQMTMWLTPKQAVNLAEYLLRCMRKQGG